MDQLIIEGAAEHNLKSLNLTLEKHRFNIITGVSGSGKSSLAFDTILAEANRRFFTTLSYYSRQFLEMGTRPAVKSIRGLSPAISLPQKEVLPSFKASIANLTDAGELLAILFSRFGTRHCPQHRTPTMALSLEDIATHIYQRSEEKLVAICAPLATGKKSAFRKEFGDLTRKGFLKVILDGRLENLVPPPTVTEEAKHDLAACVDFVNLKPHAKERLMRSLEASLALSQEIETYEMDKLNLLTQTKARYSLSAGCNTCGYSWPPLDNRHFSPGSLGRCPSCSGHGFLGEEGEEPCPSCRGTGLSAALEAITLGGTSIHDWYLEPIAALCETAQNLTGSNPAMNRVLREITQLFRRIRDAGLGYLSLARKARTLSGGENQRLRLMTILGEHLRNVIYVLDEPSQGLHPKEIARLADLLKELTRLGNTILCVDHDLELIQRADWVIDMGPGGGELGGRIMAQFKPEDAALYQKVSKTAAVLCTPAAVARIVRPLAQDFLVIREPRLNNLRCREIRLPLQRLTVFTGVSGAGKSSLMQVLRASLTQKSARHCQALIGLENIQAFDFVGRQPIAGRQTSFPATYLDVFGAFRTLYSKLPEAQLLGITASDLSLNKKGLRCEECHGAGQVATTMRFLPDSLTVCPACQGSRYQELVGDIRYLGLNLPDILRLSIDDCLAAFHNHKEIVQRLKPAAALGLGYLKLGQSSLSLSGGEAQRLKLVPFFGRGPKHQRLLCIDEPTSGLHHEDVAKLITCLQDLVTAGMTPVIIEHHPLLIAAADHQIILGPGAGAEGGQLVYEGPPRQCV